MKYCPLTNGGVMSKFFVNITNSKYPYIIAEIGANHNGDIENAKKLIDKAKYCGAHAAKFQSWTPNSVISKEDAGSADFVEQQSDNMFPKKINEKEAEALEEEIAHYIAIIFEMFELRNTIRWGDGAGGIYGSIVDPMNSGINDGNSGDQTGNDNNDSTA